MDKFHISKQPILWWTIVIKENNEFECVPVIVDDISDIEMAVERANSIVQNSFMDKTDRYYVKVKNINVITAAPNTYEVWAEICGEAHMLGYEIPCNIHTAEDWDDCWQKCAESISKRFDRLEVKVGK